MIEKRENVYFNYLKGIAAISIVLFHYNKLTDTLHNNELFPFYNILEIAYVKGGNLVEFFFMLSGVLFFMNYEKRLVDGAISGKAFFLRRIMKLYPLYLITTAVTFVLQIIHYSTNGFFFDHVRESIFFNCKYLLLNIIGISSQWFSAREPYPINSPAWYLSVSFFVYILFAVLCRTVKNDILRRTICFALSIIGYILIVKNISFPFLNIDMGRGISCFFIGGMSYLIWNQVHQRKNKPLSILIMSASVFIFISLCLFNNLYLVMLIRYISVIIFCLTLNTFVSWNCRLLNELGKISFSIYLWQFPYMCAIKILIRNIDIFYTKIFFVLFWSVLLVLSILSYVFIENRFKNTMRSKNRKP